MEYQCEIRRNYPSKNRILLYNIYPRFFYHESHLKNMELYYMRSLQLQYNGIRDLDQLAHQEYCYIEKTFVSY